MAIPDLRAAVAVTCGKTPYATRKEARKMQKSLTAQAVREGWRKSSEVYRCGLCPGQPFHVTSGGR